MDSISLAKINRGKKIMEILKQPQYQPVEVTLEILQLWLVTKGYLDDVDDRECLKASLDFATVVNTKFPKIKEVVYSKEGISQEVDKKLNAFANDFKNIT